MVGKGWGEGGIQKKRQRKYANSTKGNWNTTERDISSMVNSHRHRALGRTEYVHRRGWNGASRTERAGRECVFLISPRASSQPAIESKEPNNWS
jgi:hypothetical protein